MHTTTTNNSLQQHRANNNNMKHDNKQQQSRSIAKSVQNQPQQGRGLSVQVCYA